MSDKKQNPTAKKLLDKQLLDQQTNIKSRWEKILKVTDKVSDIFFPLVKEWNSQTIKIQERIFRDLVSDITSNILRLCEEELARLESKIAHIQNLMDIQAATMDRIIKMYDLEKESMDHIFKTLKTDEEIYKRLSERVDRLEDYGEGDEWKRGGFNE